MLKYVNGNIYGRLFWALLAVPLVCYMLWSSVILDFPLSQGSFSDECFLMYYTCTHTAAEAEPHLLDHQMTLVGSASHSHDLNHSQLWFLLSGRFTPVPPARTITRMATDTPDPKLETFTRALSGQVCAQTRMAGF